MCPVCVGNGFDSGVLADLFPQGTKVVRTRAVIIA
jgi:hypothetical protein